MVILARDWFSDSVMNFSFVPGFSASNSAESSLASVICEFDTMAIVTSFPDDPRLPAPAQPAVNRTTAAAHAASNVRSLVALSPLPHLSLRQ